MNVLLVQIIPQILLRIIRLHGQGLFLVTASMEPIQLKRRAAKDKTWKCLKMCAACKESLRSRMQHVYDGSIGSHKATVLRDTGCSGIVVQRSLVKSHKMTSKSKLCILIDGTLRRYPTWTVHIHTPLF